MNPATTENPISTLWTQQERLQVIAKIAEQMAKHPAVVRDKELQDIQERLVFLALGSAEVLEINRDAILNGHGKNHA